MRFQEYYVAALRQGWFDPCFYLDMMQSRGIALPEGDLSLFEHFATIGWRLGLSPSDRFSVERYLAQHQDVRADEVDPLYHYLTLGERERRSAFPLFEFLNEAQFIGFLRSDDFDRWDETRLALARASGISAFCVPYRAARDGKPLAGIGPDPVCLHLDCRQLTPGLEAQYRFIHDLLEIFADPRHYRVRGKPLLVVHAPSVLENAPLTLGLWREVAWQAGLGGLFIAGVPVRGEAAEDCGLDGIIDLKGAPAPRPDDSGPTGIPVFPGFLPDGFSSRDSSSAALSPDAFRAWLPAAADRTQELWTRGLPQLAFIDADNPWAGGSQAFLKATGPVREKDFEELSQLRRFAQAVTGSKCLPVLFLLNQDPDSCEPMRRLMDALTASGEIEAFTLVDTGGRTFDAQRSTASFSLRAGQTRLRSTEHLAEALDVRGDVVVVSASLATADLLAPFATRGLPIVSLVPEVELEGTPIPDIGRHARRIIVSNESAREQLTAGGAIASGDISVLQPPSDTGSAWDRYADEIMNVLLGLGNDGRRLRVIGTTAGRQQVAEDLCVVIPSYNHRDYLLEAVESILTQSVRPKEIRIIDDGSNDGSAALVRSLASDRLGIVIQVRDNRGAQATINQGVAETGCPIVAVMNSDDRWHPLRIAELIGGLRQSGGADVVFSKVRFFGFEPGCDYKRTWYERGLADYRSGTPLWLALMFCNFFFTTSNLIVRRDRFLKIGGFGPLRYCHDLDYMLAAIFAGQQVRFADQTLCDYRLHARNTIDEDVTKVLFEEAWIIVKYLRRIFRRLGDAERLDVARRICEKRLASRVIGILQASEQIGGEVAHTEPRFATILEQSLEQPWETFEPGMLVQEMARLMHVSGSRPMPAMRG